MPEYKTMSAVHDALVAAKLSVRGASVSGTYADAKLMLFINCTVLDYVKVDVEITRLMSIT